MIETERPRFANGVQLREEEDAWILLVPEGAIFLNGSAAAIAQLIDGHRSFSEIVDALAEQFSDERERIEDDVRSFIVQLRGDGVLR